MIGTPVIYNGKSAVIVGSDRKALELTFDIPREGTHNTIVSAKLSKRHWVLVQTFEPSPVELDDMLDQQLEVFDE